MFKTILSASALAAAFLLAGSAQAQQPTSGSYAMVDDTYRVESRDQYSRDEYNRDRYNRDERYDNRDRYRDDDRGDTLICESIDNRRAFCATGGARYVRIVAQISDSSCIKGRSWGYNRRGIWVDNGCRARFKVR